MPDQHAGQLIAQLLADQGVRSLFTLCGGHISPILSGCQAIGIDIVDVRDEANAVFAADATARMTGVPGVAAVTAGPGVTNTLTALKNAQLAQSPVILLGGASATVLRGRGSLQDIDQMSLVRSCVKWATSLSCVKDIPATFEHAFKVAQSGVPGPVFIELPIDLLYPESLVRQWYGVKGAEQAMGNLGKRAVQWYLNHHIERMFRGAGVSDAAAQPLKQLGNSLSDLAAMGYDQALSLPLGYLAARYLKGAKKPVMVLGSQAVCDPIQVSRLVQAVESLGIPVYLSGMARGLLGAGHPLQMRHHRKQALREADVVILGGVPCDFRLDYGNHIRTNAVLIGINRDRHDLFRNRRPTVPVHADPANFIAAVATHVGSNGRFGDWIAHLHTRDQEREAEIDTQAAVPAKHINPLALFRALDTLLTDDSTLVADGGDFVATAAYTLSPRSPLSWLDPGVFGTLGVGGGFALGARFCRPESDIWLIYGDGSSAYTLAEVDTFVRHGKGMVAIIGNDACWNQIARDQVELLGDDVGVTLRQTAYHQVAKGYGGEGFLLDKAEDMLPVLTKALALARKGKPVVINAILDRSDFRKGSISV